MRIVLVLLCLPLLADCAAFGLRTPYGANPLNSAVYGVPDAEIVVRQPQLYSRSEIDAINAEISCRSIARSSLQAQRCGIRR